MGTGRGALHHAVWPVPLLRQHPTGALPQDQGSRVHYSRVSPACRPPEGAPHLPTFLPPPEPSLLPARDGRVSENTVCLIRKLLVLDPQQRLAAADVLEALSAIIASW